MPFQLNLVEGPGGGKKAVGDNILFDNLPADYKVYALYYPGEMPDIALESALRDLGNIAGKNLLVNIGRLDDPQYVEVVRRFGIKEYPVIVVTAIDGLASPTDEFLTTFARLDSKQLLSFPERTVECVQKLFNLFIQGKVSEAIAQAKWTERKGLLLSLTGFLTDALQTIGGFIAQRDISVSLLEGKFELKRSGD